MMVTLARHVVRCRRALGGVMIKSQEYRSKALECLESAPWICDRTAKKALIDMALCWLRLADMHDAHRDPADEGDQVAATRLAGLSS
jgi:hypothetical protein